MRSPVAARGRAAVGPETMTVRDATDEDRVAIASLLGELGYPADPEAIPERVARLVENGRGRVLVATEHDRVVGVAGVEFVTPIAYADPVLMITSFVVSSAVRRRGVGRRLLAAVETLGREQGFDKAVVTSAEHRADAHAFYTRLGWTYTGRRFGKTLK